VPADGRGPSRTAAYVALFRALETRLPAEKRLFADPFADAFLDARLGAALAAAKVPVTGALVPEIIDRRSPGTRASVVVRTRFIDEAVEAALADAIKQLVILGAGFDARAYRLGAARRMRVFEVDEPVTQGVKRQRIVERLGSEPEHVTYVPVDFERDDLGAALAEAGLDASARAFITWEGVTPYLAPEAVDATLRLVPGLSASGSRIVFTYLDRRAFSDHEALAGSATVIERVARMGEPFKFGLAPEEAAGYLAERGLQLTEQIPSVELAERYLHPLGRRPPTSRFYNVAMARY
jgi:methyltransferase (TIGR00027 family)